MEIYKSYVSTVALYRVCGNVNARLSHIYRYIYVYMGMV